MRLRRWVKIAIAIIIAITTIMLIIALNNYTDKAVEKCINAGNTKTYCEKALRS